MTSENQNTKSLIPASVVLGSIIIAGAVFFDREPDGPARLREQSGGAPGTAVTRSPVSIKLPVRWGDLGQRLVSVSVIDREKFELIYDERRGLSADEKKFLTGVSDGEITMTAENAPFLLNLFWALGLAQKSEVLDSGPISDSRYGGAGRFASTGGWTLSDGHVMNHFGKHKFFDLTTEQESLVSKITKGIYRPCCDNPAHFPDCNHGMAMLGLMELAASQGGSEDELYQIALAANRFWFSDVYKTVDKAIAAEGRDPTSVPPKTLLSAAYVSASGYRSIIERGIVPTEEAGGGGCSV